MLRCSSKRNKLVCFPAHLAPSLKVPTRWNNFFPQIEKKNKNLKGLSPMKVYPFTLMSSWKIQSTLNIPTLDITTEFVINDNLTSTEPNLKRWQIIRNFAGTLLFNTLRNICFGYLLESPHRVDSNKYPKHTFYEEITIKHDICCILFCSLRILYNSKFILMAIYLGTNVVVVTRVHCSCKRMSQSLFVLRDCKKYGHLLVALSINK